MPSRNPNDHKSQEHRRTQVLLRVLGIAVLAYEVLVVVLLSRELYDSSLRATDRTLVLLGLIFLPAVLLAIMELFGKSALLTLKAGGVELLIQQKVDDSKQHLRNETKALGGMVSNAERALYPMLGGPDPHAHARLRADPPRLIIGSKDFGSNIVVTELLVQHLEQRGIHCQHLVRNGGTVTNYACLLNGWIDLCVDYTGTGAMLLRVDHLHKSPTQVVEELNRHSPDRHGFEWMRPLNIFTDYCVVVRRELADKLAGSGTASASGQQPPPVSALADLKWLRKLRLCADHEVCNRSDGLEGLKAHYRLEFAREDVCSYDERYAMLKSGEADVCIGHTTDPEIVEYNLVPLVDDREFFPRYFVVPVARRDALDAIPQLDAALESFAEIPFENADISRLVRDYRENPDALSASAARELNHKRELARAAS